MKKLLLALSLGLFCVALAAQKPPAADDDDFTGTYSFLRKGELLEFHVQPDGRVIGDVTRMDDPENGNDDLITHFFDKATLEGNKVWFTTRTVHALRYEFRGQVVRGEGKTRAEEDYFRITGTLTEYRTDEKKVTRSRDRQVVFKSAPDAMYEETPQPKH